MRTERQLVNTQVATTTIRKVSSAAEPVRNAQVYRGNGLPAHLIYAPCKPSRARTRRTFLGETESRFATRATLRPS